MPWDYPLAIEQFANLKMAIFIVDLPMKFMVIFHIVMVKGLTEGTHSDGAAGRSLHSPLSRSCTCVELSLTL